MLFLLCKIIRFSFWTSSVVGENILKMISCKFFYPNYMHLYFLFFLLPLTILVDDILPIVRAHIVGSIAFETCIDFSLVKSLYLEHIYLTQHFTPRAFCKWQWYLDQMSSYVVACSQVHFIQLSCADIILLLMGCWPCNYSYKQFTRVLYLDKVYNFRIYL